MFSDADRGSPAAMINEDVQCIRCGYNLRGLDEGGSCPECAAAVSDSLRGDLLRYADRRWLDRVYRGMALIATGHNAVLIAFFAGVLLFGTLAALEAAGVLKPAVGWVSFVQVAFFAALAAFTATFLAGFWLLAAAEPRERHDPAVGRRLARTLHRISIPAFIAWAVLPDAVPIPYVVAEGGAHLLALVLGIHWTVMFFEAASYERRCARFSPKRSRSLKFNKVLGTILMVIPIAYHWIVGSGRGGPPIAPMTPWMHVAVWVMCAGTYQHTLRAIRAETGKSRR